MKVDRGLGVLVFFLSLATMTAFAFPPIPKESGKALGVTRGKPFSSGAVFVNGKYIEPPYVVERWGTGVRINKIPVTGQIVDWNEFLKTQSDVKVAKKEVKTASAQSAAAASVSDEMSSLDDLFDDDPKPKKTTVSRPTVTSATPKPAKSNMSSATTKSVKTVMTYSLDGEFTPNGDSKALLNRVNAARTEIDRALRAGGFICFGDSYSQVQGDRRTFMEMLERLPEILQRSSDEQSFQSGIRAAKLVYLNETLCRDLFHNRMDYRKLAERREKIKADRKWDQILEGASNPIF